MKFLIGCSADRGFIVGNLRYDDYFSFSCECLMPYRESYIDYDELAEIYWDDMPDGMKLRLLEEQDCTPVEAREKIREDEEELLYWGYNIDKTTMPNLDDDMFYDLADDVFYDLISFGQYNPRKDDPDLYLPQSIFDGIMTAWDKYHLKNSKEAREEFNALTQAITANGYDCKENWREFVGDKIIEFF